MTKADINLLWSLGSKVVEEEFEYFKKYALRFDNNKPSERYGILPMGAKPSVENMIYAPDPRSLRRKDLQYIASNPNGGSIGYRVRKHIDWIERMEGKQ